MNPLPAAVPTDRFLRQHHRFLRLAWPLGTVALGLALTLALDWRRHPTLQRVERWDDLLRWWAAGLGLTGLAALGVWLVRRRNALQSARLLDARFDARNRLETVAVLRGDAGALAHAQREEAAAFLAGQADARTNRDPLLILGALVVALLLAHGATLLTWTRPWVAPAAVAAARLAAKAPAAPPALPTARILWKTPASETKATPIEEVPLQAVADSTGGLRDMVLEIAVNGQPRTSVPVPADGLQAAGKHPVQASIYLDQVEVEPFDIVSYYLRAQRIGAQNLPATASSVQFVQVRPFRSDTREVPGGEGYASYALITALKVAQLRLIKQNFVLGHTDLGQDSAEWKKENGRVGGEQAALETKTAEAVKQLIEEAAPAEVVNLLNQAQPFMGQAAQKIGAALNQPALGPQGKALALITEVEKFIVKLAPHGGIVRGSKPNVDDPFKDKQQIELKQRFKTPAGEVELLAAAQAKVAEDLSKPDAAEAAPAPDTTAPPDANKIEGTLAERQPQISQRVGALLTGRVFKPDVTQHLEQGHEAARGSLRQIDAGDLPAAREPAALAARELQAAAAAMNRAGEEQAKAELADAQRALNEAAEQARDAARQPTDEAARQRAEQAAQQAKRTAQALAEQARQQQETGSSEAAARLKDLAKEVSAADTRKALEQLRAQPRNPKNSQAAADQLTQLAGRAAAQQHPGGLSPEELARLVERLERARANMERLAANGQRIEVAALTANRPQDQTPKPGDGGEPRQLDKPGSPKPTSQPKPPGQEKQGQPGEPKPGGQCDSPGQGEGGKGQGQGPGEKGPGKEGQGQGQGQGQPGQGRGTAPQGRPGQGTGQQGQGGTGPSNQAASGQGGGASDSSAASNAVGDPNSRRELGPNYHPTAARTESELGDTYGTTVSEQRTGPVPAGRAATNSPRYTDHAARTAQTRDPQAAKEEFARELVEDIRESAQTAAAVVPKSEALAEVQKALGDVPVELHLTDQAALFARLDPPLLGLINQLREGAPAARREHQLTEKNVDLAPPAYRSAVADYYEQLSRDYADAPPAPRPE